MTARPLDIDPYPSIPCALLHSGDIRKYSELNLPRGPLFDPFNPEKVKSATYEVSFAGCAYWWNPDRTGRIDKELDEGDFLEIPRNGIVFVSPRVKFNVPDYLALRFNLHIRLVHRGLLLGTGPLVDPGFSGQLLIPVHNLTDHPVVVGADEGFIWIEVTKVSPLPEVGEDGGYRPFPTEKTNLKPWQYFQKANHGEPIRSSMHSIEDKLKEAEGTLRGYTRWSLWTAVGTAIGAVSMFIGTWAIWRDVYEFVGSVRSERGVAISKEVSDQTALLKQRIDSLEKALEDLRLAQRQAEDRIKAQAKEVQKNAN